jgi:hypothetical protein
LFVGDEATGNALIHKFTKDAICAIYQTVDKKAIIGLNDEGSLLCCAFFS